MSWIQTAFNAISAQLKTKLSKSEALKLFQKKEDAFSGKWEDLSGDPIQSDWEDNNISSAAYIKNKPDLDMGTIITWDGMYDHLWQGKTIDEVRALFEAGEKITLKVLDKDFAVDDLSSYTLVAISDEHPHVDEIFYFQNVLSYRGYNSEFSSGGEIPSSSGHPENCLTIVGTTQECWINASDDEVDVYWTSGGHTQSINYNQLVRKPITYADWNISDSQIQNYIANRPFYDDHEIVYLDNEELTFEPVRDYEEVGDFNLVCRGKANPLLMNLVNLNLFAGGTLRVIIDGIDYWLTMQHVVYDDADYYRLFDDITYPPIIEIHVRHLETAGQEKSVIIYLKSQTDTHTFTIKQGITAFKALDEKFIPDMSSIVLKSSSNDSTKKFKITVDDSGTLSAIEITE